MYVYIFVFTPRVFPTYSHTHIPTYLHTYIPTYMPTYVPTYLHTLHRYIHAHIIFLFFWFLLRESFRTGVCSRGGGGRDHRQHLGR